MTNMVIERVEQVTVEWLAAALAKRGGLTHGRVESFEVETGGGNWSSNAILVVHYSPDARGSLPGRLFLKMVNTDLDDESFGDSEVTYYTRDYLDVEESPLIGWYDAGYSDELHRYHILMDDVSETHVIAREKTPDLEYGLALAEGLAVMHARWWGPELLAAGGAPIHSPEHIRNFVALAAPGVGHILGQFESELEPHWPGLMAELFAHHPDVMIRRARDLNGFTLIHGDAGEGNILVPRQGARPVYLIDRQPFNWSLTTWLGAYDLAYALVLDWPVEIRRACERAILERYHEVLLGRGVAGYTLEQLWLDYRLSVALCVTIPTEYCRGGVNKEWVSVWMLMLRRALTACDDLDCRALLAD